MSTVVIGSARDVVEECAVPRFAFTDLPLGNPCGKPYDRAMQLMVVETALDLLECAFTGQTTVRVPVEWGDDAWRDSYMAVSSAVNGPLGHEQTDRLDV